MSAGAAFGYTFPAIRGIQARREFYVSMCPLKLIPRIFLFNEEELVPELRAQRVLNKARVPDISNYIVSNRQEYVFSALTASVDADIEFIPFEGENSDGRIGVVRIPMEASFIINDGQHRRAAIEEALRECPDLADETIAVVLFLDSGLKRCQQMFADLNRYAVKPSHSLGILYDHNDEWAELSRRLVSETEAFRNAVEMEKTSLSPRSKRLFTLSAIHGATKQLFSGLEDYDFEWRLDMAKIFWTKVDEEIPVWKQVRENKLTAGELRQDYIHTHAIVLTAVARVGNYLLGEGGDEWVDGLKGLGEINWQRSNMALWGGRTIIHDRIQKSGVTIALTANVLKRELGLKLTEEEELAERQHGDVEV